jgi:hypothetical protein
VAIVNPPPPAPKREWYVPRYISITGIAVGAALVGTGIYLYWRRSLTSAAFGSRFARSSAGGDRRRPSARKHAGPGMINGRDGCESGYVLLDLLV